jgi:hypothetical protein
VVVRSSSHSPGSRVRGSLLRINNTLKSVGCTTNVIGLQSAQIELKQKEVEKTLDVISKMSPQDILNNAEYIANLNRPLSGGR